MINSYRFGEIVVDNITYRKDLFITECGVHSNWRREKGHHISLNDLDIVINHHPEILIIGTGSFGRVEIDESVKSFLDTAGIQLLEFKTDTACKTYNDLTNENDIIAALHLTC